MTRKTFAQILKEAKIDIRREYDRLYHLFYESELDCINGEKMSLYEMCEEYFMSFPYRGTCLSLEEFNECNGFQFERDPSQFDIDYFILFCEYSYNLAVFQHSNGAIPFLNPAELYIQQLFKVIELVGYMQISESGIVSFVPKSQPAIVVSEMLPTDLSYKVIEYNHHSMKGDLKRKQATLKLLADQLEAKRKELSGLNKSLADDLFFLFNNVNVRHNNIDPQAGSFNQPVADMSEEELEQWYDDTYDTCLLAFMILDQAERKNKISELKKKINP